MDVSSHDPSPVGHDEPNAALTAAADIESEPPHKRSRLSHDGPSASTQDPHPIERRSPISSAGPRRAAQACLRCRKQKLRCLGGRPCARCIKADRECDFGKPSQQAGGPEDSHGSTATTAKGASTRLENLESSVANLLAGLSRPGLEQGSATLGRITDGHMIGNWAYPVDSLPHPHSGLMTAVLSQQTQNAPSQPSPSSLGESTNVGFAWQGDLADLSQGAVDVGEDRAGNSKSKGKGVEPEERLAVATRDEIQPPFKALVFNPAVWENQERSRLNSPHAILEALPSAMPHQNRSHSSTHGSSEVDKDPVSSGLIDLPTARSLFQFYVAHCHSFLPVIDISLDNPFVIVQQSPLLFSAVVAIAARSHTRYHIIRQDQNSGTISLDTGISDALARLAEEHLGRTLLRKQHTLSDVRAILLTAAWGLQSGGAGPDAWVLTGHAMRIAQRLGVHRVVNSAVDDEGPTKTPGGEDRKAIPQWRAWLAWYSFDAFLSLGFGRYQSTRTDAVDEEAFLRARLDQPIPRPGTSASLLLYGDTYITSVAQLSKLVRALVSWTETQSSGMTPSSQRNEGVLSMLKDLNGRLDEWSKLWVWSESPYALYLGPSARIARLQAEHLRLSINSIALHSSVDQELDSIHPYLRKALNAATSTIQTHFESSQSDLALSFATDYLTITLAQAAIFLVRLAQAPLAVQSVLSLDKSVIAHYLTMSVDSLKLGDISETRLSTYLARTISEISRAAGIKLKADDPLVPSDFATGEHRQDDGQSIPGPGSFDIESFWATDDQFDLSEILGLTGKPGSTNDWLSLAGTGNGDSFEMFNSTWGVGDSSGGESGM